MESIEILRPAIVLGAWTAVMAIWMAVTRLPALSKAKVAPNQARNTDKLNDLLPDEVQRVARNYNHLFEQPTLFYAIVIIVAILGHADSLHVQAAWLFTALRIAHSLVQATADIVLLRFSLFIFSWLALALMIVREMFAAF